MTSPRSNLVIEPLNRDSFAEFGDVVQKSGAENFLINGGRTRRYNNLALADSVDNDIYVSIFCGEPSVSPLEIDMMERHPLGSQIFFPLQNRPWLIVVASDDSGKPGVPRAFMASGEQGVSYRRNVWHYPLLCLESASDFLVVDRAGSDNLEEYEYPSPYTLKF